MFVVIVKALAATNPVLGLAERCLGSIAKLGGGTPGAWWLAIQVIAPLLGSLITEPAAMTIGALLLSRQLYELEPSIRLRYAMLGLLFVNLSIGGTLTNFATPPVIMVAHARNWGMRHMLTQFGWRSTAGIAVSTLVYYACFRRELSTPSDRARDRPIAPDRHLAPLWVTFVHLGFLAFTVWQAHELVLIIGSFLFFLATAAGPC